MPSFSPLPGSATVRFTMTGPCTGAVPCSVAGKVHCVARIGKLYDIGIAMGSPVARAMTGISRAV